MTTTVPHTDEMPPGAEAGCGRSHHAWVISRRLVVAPSRDPGWLLVLAGRSGEYRKIRAQRWRNLQDEQGRCGYVRRSVEFEELIRIGVLVPLGEDEREAIVRENMHAIETATTLRVVLLPSGGCNFGCDYCGQRHTKEAMSHEVVGGVLRYVEAALSRGSYHGLEVAWFGGEPLLGLETIRELSRALLAMCGRIGVSYAANIVTNGSMLTPKIAKLLVEECEISGFEVTIDGPRDVHDARRPLKSGHGSYELVLANVEALAALSASQRIQVSIRCNVDQRNVGRVRELIDVLVDAGLHRTIRLYFAGVYAWGQAPGQGYRVDAPVYAAEQLALASYAMERGFAQNIVPGRKRTVCVHVAKDAVVVAPDGQAFTCTEVPLVREYEPVESGPVPLTIHGAAAADPGLPWRWGHIEGDVAEHQHLSAATWNQELLSQAWPCADCAFLALCGGACPKQWREGRRACPPFKFNMPERLQLLERMNAIALLGD